MKRNNNIQNKPTFTTLAAPPPSNSTKRITLIIDKILVSLSSIFIVGGVVWVPLVYSWLYTKWKRLPHQQQEEDGTNDDNDKEEKQNFYKKKNLYRNIIMIGIIWGIWAPHRRGKVGDYLNFRNWRIIKAWVNYMAYEVISEIGIGSISNDFDNDNNNNVSSSSSSSSITSTITNFDMKKDQAIFGIVPHGIVPISLGFAALPQIAIDTFGGFRPVVATATKFLPVLRTFISWIRSIDANKIAVERAIMNGDRIGISPGGITEIFEGYPKPGRLPDDECVLLKSRKGFVKLALKHKVPLIPVYCFGATKMFKRLQLPVLEKISTFLRISIVLFFGKYGKDNGMFQYSVLYAYEQKKNDSLFFLIILVPLYICRFTYTFSTASSLGDW